MRRVYRIPIMGEVEDDTPLKGSENNPLCAIPLSELPNFPTIFDPELGREVNEGYTYTCLEYNLDEDWVEIELEANEPLHNWLLNLIPQLRNISTEKNWKLDKTKLKKIH